MSCAPEFNHKIENGARSMEWTFGSQVKGKVYVRIHKFAILACGIMTIKFSARRSTSSAGETDQPYQYTGKSLI